MGADHRALIIPATAGWLAGYAVAMAHRVGWRAATRDRRVLGAMAGVVVIVARDGGTAAAAYFEHLAAEARAEYRSDR